MARDSRLVMTALAILLGGAGGSGGGGGGSGGGSGGGGGEADLNYAPLSYAFPDFESTMGNRKMQWGWWFEDDEDFCWKTMRGLYEENVRKRMSMQSPVGGESPGSPSKETASPRIPRIIHQIWLGGNIPEQFLAWRNTWIDLHPEWQHILWTEEDVEELAMLNPEAYKNAPNLGAKSDLLRLEVVWRFGGLYIDIDFECLKSFDVLHDHLDFYAGLSNVGAMEISNGIFAARKKHPILKKLLMDQDKKLPAIGAAARLNWVGMPTITASGPGRFTRVFARAMREIEAKHSQSEEEGDEDYGFVAVLPIDFFFALPNSVISADLSTRKRMTEEALKPCSFAIHHWAGSWLKVQYGLPAWSSEKDEREEEL